MASLDLTTGQLDYLQRSGLRADRVRPDVPVTQAPPRLRALAHIRGIGRQEKPRGSSDGFGGPGGDGAPGARLPSEDVLIGLYGYKTPLAFLLHARSGAPAVHLGVWSPEQENAAPAVLTARLAILGSALRSLYPAVDLLPVPDCPLGAFRRAGLALGIPTVKPPDRLDGALPVDRLIRALDGSEWAALVLAQPVDESVVTAMRHSLLNESRSSQSAAESLRAPSPLARHYAQLLDLGLDACSRGQAVGMWRTAVYLLGQENSYYGLASAWRGIFSGEASLPEPIRVWDNPAFAELALCWALPDSPAPDGPGLYRHPFEFQTLLTSSQLAAYVHLPSQETSGFSVSAVPSFDMVPAQAAGDDTLRIGRIVTLAGAQAGANPQGHYAISAKQLTKHALVAGVTGSGKTNTIFHLLKEADARGVPFLVIEPAKTEYRSLLDDPDMRHPVRVFTPGNERVSPFRLNPFEIVTGISVSVHLDLLRSVFSASFGMWTPLPQILEQSLHELYSDYGWDITSNRNARDPGGDSPLAYPTLSALSTKVDEVIGRLGYEAKLTDDFRAALHTRLDSLRSGGKGRMLDVERSFPIEDLLDHPAVLELEGMGDDDDKAFMMGLLLIRLAEQRVVERRRGRKPPDPGEQPPDEGGLRHLLVIEEAHRLLANVGPRRSAEEADPRGKAVEAFANLLSEIRAYGQGVIVADQVPVKLAPDVIKNTNLKLAHRVLAEDDRTTLAGAMVMNPAQCRALATLGVGQAVAFAELDDAPLLVHIGKAKGDDTLSDQHVMERMQALRSSPAYRDLLRPFSACAQSCAEGADTACPSAQRLVEKQAFRSVFAHLILSAMEGPEAIDRLWPSLLGVVSAARPPQVDHDALLRCVLVRAAHALAGRRGAQGGWPYSQVARFADAMRGLLLAKLAGARLERCKQEFQEAVGELHHRSYCPYPSCSDICATSATCLYRHPVADLVAEGAFEAAWREADEIDSKSAEGRRVETWAMCQDAAYRLIEWPEAEWPDERRAATTDAATRVALCFAQQILARDVGKSPRTAERIMRKLIHKEAS